MKIKICGWKTCTDRFWWYILERLMNDKTRLKLSKLEIEKTLCMWQCAKWPNIMIKDNISNYMNPAKASEMALNKNGWKKKKKNNNNKKNTVNKSTVKNNTNKKNK